MTDIKLGQSITGAFTADDPKISGYSIDQYDLTGLDDYRQLTIDLTCSNTSTPLLINLIDTKTGNVVAVRIAGGDREQALRDEITELVSDLARLPGVPRQSSASRVGARRHGRRVAARGRVAALPSSDCSRCGGDGRSGGSGAAAQA